MITLIVLNSLLLVLVVGVGVLVALRVRGSATERLIADRLAVRVVVTLLDGTAFSGLIADQDDGWLLLRETEALGQQGSRVGVDGELLLPRGRISFMQKP